MEVDDKIQSVDCVNTLFYFFNTRVFLFQAHRCPSGLIFGVYNRVRWKLVKLGMNCTGLSFYNPLNLEDLTFFQF